MYYPTENLENWQLASASVPDEETRFHKAVSADGLHSPSWLIELYSFRLSGPEITADYMKFLSRS